MSRKLELQILVLCALSVAACGKKASGTSISGAQAPQPATSRNTGNACDRKMLISTDAATVLSDPVTGTKTIAGDPQSCEFTTASFSSATVTLRPGVGRTTVATWKSGRMPLTATPLTGIGDEAVWVSSLSEVVAEKGNLLCDIQVTNLPRILRKDSTAAQTAIGALCNKIFSEAR